MLKLNLPYVSLFYIMAVWIWQDSSELHVACHILSGKLDLIIQQVIR